MRNHWIVPLLFAALVWAPQARAEGASWTAIGDHLGIYVSEVVWWPARPLWFMLWSGVFERFPRLKVVLTEAGCAWVPPLLARAQREQRGAWHLRRVHLFPGLDAAAAIVVVPMVQSRIVAARWNCCSRATR